MNKKSQIIKSFNITNLVNPVKLFSLSSLWLPLVSKFIKNIMKAGKNAKAEKQLSFLIYYWKITFKRDFFFDFTLILNYYIWPLILLKVKKSGKVKELPGLLQLEQRWYNNIKNLLKENSRTFLKTNLSFLALGSDFNNQFKHIKKTSYRNIRFLRYRW